MNIAWVRQQLPGRRIDYYDSIPSTMPLAKGCPPGTVIVAGEQTAGKGRYGRLWHSEPHSGLYFSVVLADTCDPVVTLALGLAVRDAIHRTTRVVCDLRWPNDILIDEKKAAGILTQLEGGTLIAGIGINVNHSAFPPDLEAVATSLRIVSGRPQSREHLLTALLPLIDAYCALSRQSILETFSHASSYVRNRRVSVDGKLHGTTAGLNESGFLLLDDDHGRQHTIVAGGVRPCS